MKTSDYLVTRFSRAFAIFPFITSSAHWLIMTQTFWLLRLIWIWFLRQSIENSSMLLINIFLSLYFAICKMYYQYALSKMS